MVEDVQKDSTLLKRVVHLINSYPQPKNIFEAITSKEHEYAFWNVPELPIRDRAIMATYYASAGRGAEVCGGRTYMRSLPTIWNEDKKRLCVVCNKILEGTQRKFCSKECRNVIHSGQPDKDGNKHQPIVLEEDCQGILIENMSFDENRILISEMPVVKRSQAVKLKYGHQATIRPPYAIPLKVGIYRNPFWDQLVPFGWLIMEYYLIYIKNKVNKGKLFNIQNKQAYDLIQEITGNYLNWFRAQGKHFYGYFLMTDVVKLSKFVNDQDIKSEIPYIGYDWTEQLKDVTMAMDFNWIEPATTKIKKEIEKVLKN